MSTASRQRRRVATGATLVALVALTGACRSVQGASPDASQQSAALEYVDGTAKASADVGSVSWNLPYEPASLDPIKTQVFADAPVTSNLCESLLRVKPDLSVEPHLAKSVTRVNPLTWKYELRSDVTFWDGSPMTAVDVAASLNRNLDPKLGSYWSLEYRNVKRIAATGDHEVTITFNRPDALLNQVLATSAGAVSKADVAAKAGADYGSAKSSLMCTGPFTLKEWVAGDHLTISRNDAYWDKATMPRVSAVQFHFVSDPATISNALATGELEGMYQVPPAAIPQLKNSTGGKLYFGASTASLDIFPTERPGPLHNGDVRRALYLALDREAIAKNVYHGAAQPARSFVNPGVGYGKSVFDDYFRSLPDTKVDLAKAKELVAGSGTQGKPMLLATSPDPSLTSVANALAGAAQSLGLDLKVVTLTPAENDQLYFDPKLRTKYDAFMNVQWTMAPDPLEELAFVTQGSFTNYGLYDNPQFEALYYKALGVDDPAARAQAVVQALRIVDKDLPWIPVVSLPVTTFIRHGLTGVPTSWAFLYSGWASGLGGAG